MTDYIERDLWQSLPDDLPYKASVRRVLMQAPAADVRPVVRGEWVPLEHSTVHTYCSSCRRVWSNIFQPTIWNFCPNCGAEMARNRYQSDKHLDKKEARQD